MSKQKRVENLINVSNGNKKFTELIKFLTDNHPYVQKIKGEYYRSINSVGNAKERIRIAFIDSLYASGGNNLSTTGKACEMFYKVIMNLPDSEILDFQTFIQAFNNYCNENICDINGLYKLIAESEQFPNIKYKKAAIFIRNIYWLQEYENTSVFYNLDLKKEMLKIPVDIVIVTILNNILNLKGKIELKADRDFHLINEFASTLLNENHMIIEDIWFWGFFNTKVMKSDETNNRVRTIEFNSDKYYSANFIYPNSELEEKINNFKSIIINK